MKHTASALIFFAFLPIALIAADTATEPAKFVGSFINIHSEEGTTARLYWHGGMKNPQLSLDLPDQEQYDIALETVSHQKDEIVFKRAVPQMGEVTYTARLQDGRLLGTFGNQRFTWGTFALTRMQSTIVKGADAPVFSAPKIDGGTWTNGDLQGKYTLVSFWSTTCPPCIKKMDKLHKINQAYAGKDFALVSVSLDPKAEMVAKFRAGKWPMPWTNVHIPNRRDAALVKDFEVKGTPSSYLISPTGKILAKGKDLAGAKMESTLSRIIPQGGVQ